MIYVVYGTEEFLINQEINKIVNKHKIDKININKYNLEFTLIDDVIEDASMISLFSDIKAIVVDNAYILTGQIKKNELNHNIDNLIKYINNPNTSTILIFTILSEKLDERKKVVKLLKDKANIIVYNQTNNINQIVKSMLDDYVIENKDINYLISRVGSNLGILSNEIEKLKMYKFYDKVITHNDIDNCTCKTIELDIFKFIDNIINKNKNEAIETYKELLKRNEEPIKIIIMLSNQIRIMYQAKELSKEGYSESDIAHELDIHPYRVKIALQKGYMYSSELLLSHLEQLSDLDLNIKNGYINGNLGLELFILGL